MRSDRLAAGLAGPSPGTSRGGGFCPGSGFDWGQFLPGAGFALGRVLPGASFCLGPVFAWGGFCPGAGFAWGQISPWGRFSPNSRTETMASRARTRFAVRRCPKSAHGAPRNALGAPSGGFVCGSLAAGQEAAGARGARARRAEARGSGCGFLPGGGVCGAVGFRLAAGQAEWLKGRLGGRGTEGKKNVSLKQPERFRHIFMILVLGPGGERYFRSWVGRGVRPVESI